MSVIMILMSVITTRTSVTYTLKKINYPTGPIQLQINLSAADKNLSEAGLAPWDNLFFWVYTHELNFNTMCMTLTQTN
jgi:hypothetical protein